MTVRTPATSVVAGLTVVEWPGSGPTLFCLPGLGGSGRTWSALAEDLPGARILSVDLRGRGDGQGMAGPTGLLAHAKDVASILEELDLTDVVVVGHSMGAYLALLVAQEAPSRVSRLVCVDGGIRPAFPFFMTAGLVKLMFRKQLGSMDKEWPSMAAVAKKARLGKMLGSRPDLNDRILAMLEADMATSPSGTLRPRLDVQRAAEDAVDCFFGPDVLTGLENLKVPAELFLAENKQADGQKPFISDAAVAPWTARNPLITVRRVKGNHVTALFAPEVVAACTR
ncbi:MAG: alpha/beta hydrolase [Frankiales bacterium]|nr:alpha/beta hydrolase [Frankiales bacterium]